MIKRIFNIVIVIAILALGAGLISMNCKAPKTAYVEISKIYNEFQLKKELETSYDKTLSARKSLMDSVELHLRSLYAQVESGNREKQLLQEFEFKKQDYVSMQQKFEEDNTILKQQYNEQIMKQLNEYVTAYGKEQEYTYILGAEGSGTIMFADEAQNVTTEVIKYINEKYKGIK
jgi:outer membrane protein